MKRTTCTLDIEPKPAPRPRAGISGGFARVYNETPYTNWKRMVALMFKNRCTEHFGGGAVTVLMDFVFKRPQKPSHPFPSKADTDNCAKAALDAITQSAAAWLDDTQAQRLVLEKRWGDAGVKPTRKREGVDPEEASIFVGIAEWQPPTERAEQLVWEACHGLTAEQRTALATEMLQRWQQVLDDSKPSI